MCSSDLATTFTSGDLDYARRLVVHQLQPDPTRPLGPDALENLRENIAVAPAFSFHLRFVVRVLERVLAMHATLDTNGVELPDVPSFIERFRRGVEAGEDGALDIVAQALASELAGDAPTERINAHPFAVLLAIIVALLVGCAHAQKRRDCKEIGRAHV